MVFVKKWPFSHLFFLDNIAQEKVFYDILERKNAFLGKIGQENLFYDILQRKNAILGYKNKKFKKTKN